MNQIVASGRVEMCRPKSLLQWQVVVCSIMSPVDLDKWHLYQYCWLLWRSETPDRTTRNSWRRKNTSVFHWSGSSTSHKEDVTYCASFSGRNPNKSLKKEKAQKPALQQSPPWPESGGDVTLATTALVVFDLLWFVSAEATERLWLQRSPSRACSRRCLPGVR